MPIVYLLWIVPVLIIVGIVVYITNKIRSFSQALFGTESLIDGLQQEKLSASKEPRSLHSMEPVYLPMIRRDFPELNVNELKKQAERVLLSSLQAISSQKVSLLSAEVPDEIRQKVVTQIGDLKEQGLKQFYDQIKIHRTVIRDYQKRDGLVHLTLQTGLESFAKLEKDGKIISGEANYRSQLAFDSHYLYVQDMQKLKDKTALGLTCPQCGAPVTTLGEKTCTYCGSAMKEVNLRVWRLTDFHLV